MATRRKKTESGAAQLRRKAEAQASAHGVAIAPEPYTYEWYRQDWPARKREFMEREFLVADGFDSNKLKRFSLNRAQGELYAGYLRSVADRAIHNVTLKCRRLGISTFYAALYLADCLFLSDQHALIVAHDPDTLKELMETVKRFYGNLRDEVRPGAGYDSKYELVIDDPARGVRGSKIRLANVTPGKEGKGRGLTLTHLHLTEVPFWLGDQRKFLTAVLDAAKGGFVSWESTAGGVGDEFYKAYQEAKSGRGVAHFFPWWWNENYRIAGARLIAKGNLAFLLTQAESELERFDGSAFHSAQLSDYDDDYRRENELLLASEMEIARRIVSFLSPAPPLGLGHEAFEVAERMQWRREEIKRKGASVFRVEQPEDDVTAFAATGGGVFDQSYLQARGNPQSPREGHAYVVALDPAMGIASGDNAAICVLDAGTLEQVYEWAGNTEKQDAQALRACELSDRYNGATILIESNQGEAAILECERLGYGDRLYRHIDVATQRRVEEGVISRRHAEDQARPGLPMTDRLKRMGVALLEKAWRTGEFIACSPALVEEARVFVQQGNAFGAKSGHHDDRVMAALIGVLWCTSLAGFGGGDWVLPAMGRGEPRDA